MALRWGEVVNSLHGASGGDSLHQSGLDRTACSLVGIRRREP